MPKFNRGLKANLPETLVGGQYYQCTDTGELFYAVSATEKVLVGGSSSCRFNITSLGDDPSSITLNSEAARTFQTCVLKTHAKVNLTGGTQNAGYEHIIAFENKSNQDVEIIPGADMVALSELIVPGFGVMLMTWMYAGGKVYIRCSKSERLSTNYVVFETLEDNETQWLEVTVSGLQSSNDGVSWASWDEGTRRTFGNGSKLYVRGKNPGSLFTGWFEEGDGGFYKVSGVIEALYDYEDITKTVSLPFVFRDLRNLIDASGLKIGQNPDSTFGHLFDGAESLLYPPQFVSEELRAERCYEWMFANCISLQNPPVLPARRLSIGCYSYMFHTCTNLEKVPALPATELADECYLWMFGFCEKLTQAPLLPALFVYDKSYSYMFCRCANLTNVASLPAIFVGELGYASMFRDCSKLVWAPKIASTIFGINAFESMFQNCTSLKYASDLPATTLVQACYKYMFLGCIALESAPVLPAIKLESECYKQMFHDCQALKEITCYARDVSASECMTNWLNGVSAEGTFHCRKEETFERGVSGIPTNWTVVED